MLKNIDWHDEHVHALINLAVTLLGGLIGALLGYVLMPNIFSILIFAIFGATAAYMFATKK